MIALEHEGISRRRSDHGQCGRHQRKFQSLGNQARHQKNLVSLDPDHLVSLCSVKLVLTFPRHHASENE